MWPAAAAVHPAARTADRAAWAAAAREVEVTLAAMAGPSEAALGVGVELPVEARAQASPATAEAEGLVEEETAVGTAAPQAVGCWEAVESAVAG